MKETKKIAISAMMTALGAVLMSAGAVFEVIDLTACAVASLLVVLIYMEIGSPYTWLVWLTTALCTALMFPGSPVWAEYLFVFGIYPILKAYIERLPRRLWFPVKLLFINAILWVLILLVEGVLGIPIFGAEGEIMKLVLYLTANVAFIVYDLFITAMIRVYVFKFRNRFKRFFK